MIGDKNNISQSNIDIDKQQNDSVGNAAGVTSKTGTRIVLVGIIIIAICIMIYILFFSDKNKGESSNITKSKDVLDKEAYKLQEEASEVTKQQEADVVAYEQTKQHNKTKKIELPPLEESEPPAPPPPPPPTPPAPPPVSIIESKPLLVTQSNPVNSGSADSFPDIADKNAIKALSPEAKKADDMRKKAQIFVFGSGKGASSNQNIDDLNSKTKINGEKDGTSLSSNKSSKNLAGYMGFDGGIIEGTSIQESNANKSTATQVKNLDRTVLAGKIITGVLETAINTDLAGSVRAIITRDVYAEYGKNILLPKGSKILGNYGNNIKAGQIRVEIMWTRVITPQGIDISIESKGSDMLGRAGVAGVVDSKLKEKLANAFLTSLVIPYATVKLSGNNDQITTSTGSGNNSSTTVTTTAAAQVLSSGAQKFSDIAAESINSSASLTPTATVEQGTRINITVQKDLIFPVEAVKLIQKQDY